MGINISTASIEFFNSISTHYSFLLWQVNWIDITWTWNRHYVWNFYLCCTLYQSDSTRSNWHKATLYMIFLRQKRKEKSLWDFFIINGSLNCFIYCLSCCNLLSASWPNLLVPFGYSVTFPNCICFLKLYHKMVWKLRIYPRTFIYVMWLA